MATNEPTEDSIRAPNGVADRVESAVLDRREFLVGATVGGIGSVLGASTFTDGQRLGRLAALSGGDGTATRTRYFLPAVESDGQGVVVAFTVGLTDGTGDVYVNLDDVEVRHDVQLALHEAVATATRVADVPLEDRSVFVSFDPPGDERTTLRGKSWEAGLTVALVGALTHRLPSRRTLVTGVVASDGSLLPVGGVESKAVAARAFGAKTLLVPPGQRVPLSGIRVEEVATITAGVRRVYG